MTTTLKPTVFGIGINDVPGSSKKPYYKVWFQMFRRSHDPKFHVKFPTYIGCTVDPRWHHLSDFKRWYEQQGDVTGKHLDKDIISSGNKVYGPDTCLFVTGKLNQFFNTHDKTRGETPIGVHHRRDNKKFAASIGVERTPLGTYDTPEEAHQAWKKEKRRRLYEDHILPETDQRLKQALYNVYNNMEEYFK